MSVILRGGSRGTGVRFVRGLRDGRDGSRRMASAVTEQISEKVNCYSAVMEPNDSREYRKDFSFEDRIHFLRNIGISAHIDSGKTTLTERVLFYTGRIKQIHEVRGKDGVGAKMDFMELEREKGITIQSAATHTKWNRFGFNVIDTPGHVDFTIEVERALRVLDGAIMVLCGVSGVQSQSITVDRQMKRYNVPRISFINKLDRSGSNPWRIIEQIRRKLSYPAAAVQIPIGLEGDHEGVVDLIRREALFFDGQFGHLLRREECPPELVEQMEEKRRELIECVADKDEFIGDKFLMEEHISEAELYAAIRRVTLDRKFTPVFLGTALKNKGVQPLLDGVCAFLPNPTEAINFALKDSDSSVAAAEKVEIKCLESEPTIALAFKLEDGKFGQLTYLRVYQGSISKGSTIMNVRTGKKVRIPRLVRMNAQEMEDIDRAGAGEICAVFGMDCSSGDSFVQTGSDRLTMESLYVPDPVMSLSINPKGDQGQFSKAIARFTREDPTFRFHTNEETNERIISGMGELHLEIYVERLKREYKCECETGKPQVNYKETIGKQASFDYIHKKQTGGAGQYGAVFGHIEPMEDDSRENEFVDETVGNDLPPQYIPSIQKAFKALMKEGPLSGCELQGIRFVLSGGKAHAVDSSDLAFKTATDYAFAQAYANSAPTLLEPIMNLQVQIPSENQGPVIAGLSKRRAIVMNSTSLGDNVVLDLEAPLGEMFGFSAEIRSLTQGKGEFAMEYLEHRFAPAQVVKKVSEEHAERQAQKRKN